MAAVSTVERVRRFLDRELFLYAPAPPRITRRRALVCAGLAALCIAIQLVRMWSSVPLNSIWAEDGAVWIPDAMSRGLVDALTTTYNGYLQTSSRLVAEPVALLPVGWFAPVMAICGAAIVTGCAFLVWRAAAGHIENPHLRAALAAMVVLLPVVGTETLDNVTNSIWFVLFAAFWVLLGRPTTFVRAAAAAGFIFFAALSNAAIVVFAPLWALRLIAIRDRRDAIIVAAFALGVAIQLAYSLGAPVQGEGGTHLSPILAALDAPHWDWSLVPAYAQRVIGGAFAGQRINGFLWENLGTELEVSLGAALLAFVAFSAARVSRTRVVVPLMVTASLGLFLVIGYRRWFPNGEAFTWPHGSSNTKQAHYMVTPTLLLLSALFVQLDPRPRLASPGAWNKLRVGTVLVVLVVALFSFEVGDSAIRGAPTWSEALDGARSRCAVTHAKRVQVPIAPSFLLSFLASASTHSTASSFEAPIPCSKLVSPP
jgi:hypothetical protein